MEYEVDGDTYCSWCVRNGPQSRAWGIWRIGNQRQNRAHLDYSIVEIGQNIEKRPKETCCFSDSSEKPPACTRMKNSWGVKMNNNNNNNKLEKIISGELDNYSRQSSLAETLSKK